MEEGKDSFDSSVHLGPWGGRGHGALLAPVIYNVLPAVYNRSLKILSLWDCPRLLPANPPSLPLPPPPAASGKEMPRLSPQVLE